MVTSRRITGDEHCTKAGKISRTELADIVLLGQVEEFSDSGGTLGTQTLGEGDVGETGEVLLALLDDDDREDLDVVTDDSTSDGLKKSTRFFHFSPDLVTHLPLPLTISAGSVARVTVRKEETNTVVDKDTLLHWETLGR